jgi:hypothetical protein
MKIMKKLFLSLGFLALTGFSYGQQNLNELPQNAQDFIHQNFSSETVEEVDKKGRIQRLYSDEMYEVEFASGVSIDFNENGEATEIESDNGQEVPQSALPSEIATYIQSNYNNTKVTNWEKEKDKQEVELADGTELEFDASGKFIRID